MISASRVRLLKCLLAVPALLTGVAASADAGVTAYGVVDAFVQVLDGTAHATRLQSGGLVGSRLGFKGTEELGGGLKAFFVLESGFNLDDGAVNQGGVFFGRQAQLGLSGPWGSLSLGRQYGSLYFATTEMSIFTNAGAGPSTVVIGGFGGGYEPVRGASATAVPPAAGATGNGSPLRVNNSVRWESPSFGGFRLSALYGAGEQPGFTDQSRLLDLGLRYTREGLDVIASWISDRAVAGGAPGATQARTRTVALAYGAHPVRVVAGYLDFKDDRRPGGLSGVGAWLGAEVRRGRQLFKVQYVLNRPRYGDDNRTQALGVGWVCDLSPRSAPYVSLTRFRNDDRAGVNGAGRFNGTVPDGLTAPGRRSVTELAVGLRHSF